MGSVSPASLQNIVHEDWLLACLATHNCDRPAAAELLDGFACDLVKHDVAFDGILCQIAARMLDRKAHHALSFSSVGDYARERLGMSARTLQQMAQIGRALRRYPALSRAMREGRVSYSKAEVLVRMIDDDSGLGFVDRLIARASTHTVRALKAMYKERRAREGKAVADDPEDLSRIDGEPAVWFHGDVPASTRALVRHVTEIASRVAGTNLTRAQALEAAAAEVLSGGPYEDLEPNEAPSAPVRSGERLRLPHHVHAPSWLQPIRSREPVTESELREAAQERAAEVYWDHVEPIRPLEPSTELQSMLAGLDDAGPHELDRRFRTVLAWRAELEYQLGRVLGCMVRRGLCEWGGFGTFSRYAADRLGLSASRARLLVRVDRQIWWHDDAVAAYRSGRVSAARLDLISEFFCRGYAPPEVASAWLQRAGEVTFKRLKQEVEWARSQADRTGKDWIMPPELGACLDEPPLEQMSAHSGSVARSGLRIRVPENVGSMLIQAMQSVAQPGDRAWQPFERMLLTALKVWRALPRHRNPIFERDGWCCSFPGCTKRRDFHEHHVTFRSQGGTNDQSNRTGLCWWHHQEAIHGGLARVKGKAPASLQFDVGTRPDGPPLLRTIGEIYA